jgi:hypothetical protein
MGDADCDDWDDVYESESESELLINVADVTKQ